VITAHQRRAHSARFIFTYRREKSDGPIGEEEWRGWVARVPNTGEDRPLSKPEQKWFRSLDELPGLLRAMLNEPDA